LSLLNELKKKAPDLEFELPNGTPVIRLGLIVTLYFREGYSLESKNTIIECFRKFRAEFKRNLNSQMYKRYGKLTDTSFAKAASSILKTDPNEQYHWQMASAETAFSAPEFCISTSNSPEVHGDRKRSYLKVILPWHYLQQPNGVEHYHNWVLHLCNETKADHGYGGLSTILPYDYHSYAPMEFQLATQYPGLEVDSLIANFKRELLDSTKGVNWYTIISNRLLEKLGGVENFCSTVKPHTDLELFIYDHGVIIRAGSFPELGSPEHLPPAYVDINRIVKPLRINNPDQLQTYSPDNNTFDHKSSALWYSRFDVLDSPVKAPSRIEAGRACTISGYWYSPAKANSRRYFEQGQLMPEFKGSSWGATLWYWSGEE